MLGQAWPFHSRSANKSLRALRRSRNSRPQSDVLNTRTRRGKSRQANAFVALSAGIRAFGRGEQFIQIGARIRLAHVCVRVIWKKQHGATMAGTI